MSEQDPQTRAIRELKQLGLREYEAKCFVSLTKITTGTAREVSQHVDVPRTRVYEAVRSLESDGLVEVQHSSPQRFRAIPVSEAIEVLEQRYRSRIATLEDALEGIEGAAGAGNQDDSPEVWSLEGADTITSRAKRLVDDAGAEVLFLVGDRQAFSIELADRLGSARERGIDVVVGTGSESVRDRLSGIAPGSIVVDPGLEWLHPSNGQQHVSVGRLLLVDDSQLLASTLVRSGDQMFERAVCGNGVSNSLVFTLRQLLSHRLGI